MIRRSLGTHDGSFHADEVTACALLLVFGEIDADKIVRTRDPDVLKNCDYVCDVGGIYDPSVRRFDHHQSEYRGILSSAGMIWLYLREREVIDRVMYDFLNDSLLLGVDAHDNGRITPEVGICTFSQVVANFVPPQYDASKQELDAAFFEAVAFVKGHLLRLLDRFRHIQLCREKVEKSMAKNEIYLFFDEAMPWMDSFLRWEESSIPLFLSSCPRKSIGSSGRSPLRWSDGWMYGSLCLWNGQGFWMRN